MIGDFETEAHLCDWFTKLGGIVVNVDYRHAPEHVFPAAIEDAFDAMHWVSTACEMEMSCKIPIPIRFFR